MGVGVGGIAVGGGGAYVAVGAAVCDPQAASSAKITSTKIVKWWAKRTMIVIPFGRS
jgi:hypothetical protein